MKLGIAFEGGASRAFFSCGVMNALMENNIKADIISGSSAGIAHAVSYASWQKERCREILEKYYTTPQYMGFKYLFKKGVRSYFNIPFVFEDIPNKLVPFDYDAFRENGIKTVAAVTNMRTAKAEYMEVSDSDKNFRVLVATCALPILFEPVIINNKEYMDGGITDAVPVDYLINEGCDKVIAVLTRPRDYIKSNKDLILNLSAKIYKKYPEFSRALKNRNINYNEARARLFELEKEGKVFIIEPTDISGVSRTENGIEKLLKIYNHGIDITNSKMESLKEYLG